MASNKNKIEKQAYRIFSNYFKNNRESYIDFEKDLNSARYPINYDIYLSKAALYSVIAGIFGLIAGFVVGFLIIALDITIPINFEVFPRFMIEHGNIFGLFFLTTSGAILFAGLSFISFYLYPSSKVGDRKREINRMMPHVIHFMYALSKSNIGLVEIIRSIASHKDTYGEVSKEMDFVIKNIDYFGMDLRESIIQLSETTPSPYLQEFANSLLSVVDSGGNISIFLAERIEQYRERARVEQKSFLDFLGLIAESYVTIVVAAPLFMMIISSILLVMGTGDPMIMYIVVYVVIPLGSIMFLFVIHTITPSDVNKVPILKTEFELENKNLKVGEFKNSDAYKSFKKKERSMMLKEYIKKPFKKMYEHPLLALIISTPIAFFILAIFGFGWIVPALFIGILPVSLFHESKARYERRIGNQTPDVLKGLSSSVASGLTLIRSIDVVAESGEIGIYKEMKKMRNNIEWGSEISDAFKIFANSVKVASLTRSIAMLTEVIHMGGNLHDALAISAKDSAMERGLLKDRFVDMFIYLLVVYLAFLVFIGIIYLLFTDFLPPLFGALAGGSGGIMTPIKTQDEIEAILIQATILQSIFCGMMAGQLSESNFLSGLKHTLVMLVVVWVLFTFLI
jgi:flagellar protein FlaJ